MKQQPFIARHRPEWERFRLWLEAGESELAPARERNTGKKGSGAADKAACANGENEAGMATPAPLDAHEVPAVYRRICHHLALARTRLYSPLLIEELAGLVRSGHDRLYGARGSLLGRIARFYLRSFPVTVRREWRLLALASALFYGPLLVMLILLQYQPDLVHTVLGNEMITGMETAYDPAADPEARAPRFDNRVAMWGYYIYNNTSIGFRTFAGGLLFGLGTLFFLVFNGLTIGAVAGHITQMGFIDTFWPFVAGHGAFELTAICLSGAAGLRLGLALLSPQRYSRLQAMRLAADSALPIILGAATLFVMAAFVEAFWSPQNGVEPAVKYAVSAVLWGLTGWYFLRAGRRS